MLGAALAIALMLPGSAIAANLQSDFDLGDEGWTVVQNDADPDATSPPTWSGSGGNPGGYVSAQDLANDEPYLWFLVAPGSWSGDLRSNYGGTLRYDVRHSDTTTTATPVFVIVDAAGNSLEYTPGGLAGTDWTQFGAEVREGLGWCYNPSGSVACSVQASQTDFWEVLEDVVTIRVLGDLKYASTGETTSFDNISLSEPATQIDSDGDGVPDYSDNCPFQAGPASNNGCPVPPPPPPPPDADGDGVPDSSDNCSSVPGPASNGGCPVESPSPSGGGTQAPPVTTPPPGDGSTELARTLSIAYSEKKDAFGGKLASQAASCISSQQVSVFEKKKGKDPKLGSRTTNANGKYSLKEKNAQGKFYAQVGQTSTSAGPCLAAQSKAIKVG
jgi:hypothetical protein